MKLPSNRKKPPQQKMKTTQLINFFNLWTSYISSVDSQFHIVSLDYLLPDLDRRFQALLKLDPPPPFQSRPASPNPDRLNSKSQDDVDPDDLFARFAAIKAPNNTTSNSIVRVMKTGIEKIIGWARDSARLDNSPLSDL
ncbi:hypothetical protein OIU84_008475 [Salix udensis]|uniref:Uncharacterized protein n=1 Tax=Salix udensis TaxID=889485 RepID=A0AAD6JRB0_9ROSI|nr:hypothetical protein OIU84_008475 [Salix udensis]